MSTKTKRLKALQKALKDAQAPESRGGGNRVPDGKYEVTVSKCQLREIEQFQGKPLCVSWGLEIITGDHAGRLLFKDISLEGEYAENNLGIVKADFTVLHLQEEAEEDLEAACEAALDRVLRVTVRGKKNRPDRYNVFFNSLIDAPVQKALAAEDDDGEDEVAEEEPKPRSRKSSKAPAPKPKAKEESEDEDEEGWEDQFEGLA